MDNFATRCASEIIKAPCNARKSSRYCDWITLTQVNEVFFIMMSIISITIIVFKARCTGVYAWGSVDYYFHKPILPHSVTNLLIHVNVSPGSCNLNRLWRRLQKISLISNSNIAFTLVIRIFFSWRCSKRMQQRLTYPLSPNVQIQILHTSVHKLPYRISWQNLIKDQCISPLFIIFVNSPNLSFDDVLILFGENWCWSLLGLKGLRWLSPPTLNARYMK